jgi:5'-nucleotidase
MPATRTLVAIVLSAWIAGAACAPQAPEVASPARPVELARVDAGAQDAHEAAAPHENVHVQILAFNDLHGYLEPPAGSTGYVLAPLTDPVVTGGAVQGIKIDADAGTALVPAGGAAYLATHIRALRARNPNTIIVSAGDLTGASPLLSNLFNDEPTVLAMNQIGLDFEGVGNHDFDRGLGALERLQHGGCLESDAGECDGGRTAFAGARYQYLAANVRQGAADATVFPAYAIREVAGVKIAFVGVTLEATPSVTVADAVRGLAFANEISTVNALVPELKRQGVSAIVLLVHQGGFQGKAGTYDSCDAFSGTLERLLEGDPSHPGLDPAVDVVASGHTHQAYDCLLEGRIVTSAASYGRLLTRIDLTIDPVLGRVVEKHANNIPITRDVDPDPEVLRTIALYKEKAAPRMNRVVGYVKADFVGNAKVVGSPSCETPLGDLIADSELAATRDPAPGKADIAFMNPGGIRADLLARQPGRAPNAVTYGDAFEVQPFGNELVTMSLTGTQIRELLLLQFGKDRPRVLQPSQGFSYTYRYNPFDRRVDLDLGAIRLRGAPLAPDKAYRVTVSNFLAEGGDDFAPFKQGTHRVIGGRDIDALTAYLSIRSTPETPLAPHPPRRVVGNACR